MSKSSSFLKSFVKLSITFAAALFVIYAVDRMGGIEASLDRLSLEIARVNMDFRSSGASGSKDTLTGSYRGSAAHSADRDQYPADSADLLLLVNPWNALPEGYAPPLYTLSDGTQVDERCVADLMDMLDDCREAGGSPYICSAYRTEDYQWGLFNNKVQRLKDAGLSDWEAETEAAKVVAYPGTSEHQLGLAMDIIDSDYTTLDEGQEDTYTQEWLMDNSWRYGFILRYPNGKSDVTGIIYEPWHYRYVGLDAAKAIYDSGLCLEEYLAQK